MIKFPLSLKFLYHLVQVLSNNNNKMLVVWILDKIKLSSNNSKIVRVFVTLAPLKNHHNL